MNRKDLSGTTINQKYALEKRIGYGHFGDVYLAQQTVIARKSAVKLVKSVDDGFIVSILEPQLLNLAQHARIVQVHHAEYATAWGVNAVLIEMEYLRLGSLQDAIEAGYVPLATVISAIKDVLFALEHAHGKNIIHRDVKPANIMLTSTGAKLSDFGIAMISSTGQSPSDATYNGNKAPECFLDQYDARTDIYAAGLSLFRATNRIVDWKAQLLQLSDPIDTLQKGKLIQAIGIAKSTPRKVANIIRKACNPIASKRYASAAEFRDALEKIQVKRNWKQHSPTKWTCKVGSVPEIIEIIAGKKTFAVEYTRNGRRKLDMCATNQTHQEAVSTAHELVAHTSVD